MSESMGRRTFLYALGCLLASAIEGCADERLAGDTSDQIVVDEKPHEDDVPEHEDAPEREETSMQISVIVNDEPFTAAIEDTEAGRALLERLPLTLSMEELHGNEKYCYTGESFGGEQYVPETIEAGDLMVFGSDCLVLFYETFANGGWSYARVGRVDDPSGLAEACGSGTATVEFAPLS